MEDVFFPPNNRIPLPQNLINRTDPSKNKNDRIHGTADIFEIIFSPCLKKILVSVVANRAACITW